MYSVGAASFSLPRCRIATWRNYHRKSRKCSVRLNGCGNKLEGMRPSAQRNPQHRRVRNPRLRMPRQFGSTGRQTMNSAKLMILGGMLGVLSQAALAFQETNSGGQGASSPQGPAAQVGDLGTPAAGRSAGPEIKVPGLGTIGALPKLDFGLELLYGAATPQNGPRDDKSDAGTQIRGTLKYRFPN